jgi:sec-independent protein translocase protein TatA
MPFNIGPFELLLVLILALLVLGPGKLPEVGSALGRTIREFRKASSDVEDSLRVEPATSNAAAAQPVTPSAPAPAADAPVAEAPADATEDSAKS